MQTRRKITVDGNEAVASVAYRTNEVIAIYPITPASAMGELADAWAGAKRPNLWGDVPEVIEMQSEGGAAGTVHGALQGGCLTTTFTASQGLLLMIPNLYKIAGELTPFVLHVAARAVATHALSIFGDHSDVMAVRPTGMAMLASASPQEAQDFALVAQAATLASRVPFLHFFDGFRTSHEIAKIEELTDDDLLAMLDAELIAAHRGRALSPDRPVLRGTAQNPDAFFQAREASNRFYDAVPAIVEACFERFAGLTGRRYRLFEYSGDPLAERVVVLMGSGGQTARETVEALAARGEKVGVLEVRLYRPFSPRALLAALPPTTRTVAVLDRTKEPGSLGEPLFLDVVAALAQAQGAGESPFALPPLVIGGRYGLASKEFPPAAVAAVFAELAAPSPRSGFTVGIVDDVTHTSLAVDPAFDVEAPETVRALFYGLGADGTVGANKSSIKIIGEATELFAQGYFVYDSKKSGAVTVSHLRFGPRPIRSAYLIRHASFVACHQFGLLERLDVLAAAAPGATVLLDAPMPPDEVWDHLPFEMQEQILAKDLAVYAIDAHRLAREGGLGGRVNTIFQTCFFALTGVLEQEEAIRRIKRDVEASYGKRGQETVRRNHAVIDQTLAHVAKVPIRRRVADGRPRPPLVAAAAPDFVQRVTATMLAGKGDMLPVSAFPVDGTWPTATSQWEKRRIAQEVPIWDPAVCIQCNQCALACPHAAIRAKVFAPEALVGAPELFLSTAYKAPDLRGSTYVLQVAPEDCTGCRLCVEICPAKDKKEPRRKAINMQPLAPVLTRERENFRFFLDLPEVERERLERLDAKASQFLRPLFEFSGACAGCGETPYLKLLSQLFGDRLLVANATGCSSIFGGNLPTTPWAVDGHGRGPAWANSLFEDNAEFGLGLRLAVDQLGARARRELAALAVDVGDELAEATIAAEQTDEATIADQRARVAELKARLARLPGAAARGLEGLADWLVEKSVWLVGGDGWAYDIGYGGLDHVLAVGRKVNVLVLDTEVYSNTGGQQSKATPLGAAAKFAANGRELPKKDLGLEMMTYGHVYVARIAFGAKMNQAALALSEAEAYPGPSLVIAYSPCIAHGYDLALGGVQQKRVVESGIWPLYRFDPRRAAAGEPPLQLDSGPPSARVEDFMNAEARFRMVEKIDPFRYRRFVHKAEVQAKQRWEVYRQLAGLTIPQEKEVEP